MRDIRTSTKAANCCRQSSTSPDPAATTSTFAGATSAADTTDADEPATSRTGKWSAHCDRPSILRKFEAHRLWTDNDRQALVHRRGDPRLRVMPRTGTNGIGRGVAASLLKPPRSTR